MLLTTQYLDEADRLANQIVIIDHGCVIASGSSRELKARVGRDVVEIHVCDHVDVPRAAQALSQIGQGESRVDPATLLVSITVDAGAERLMQAIRSLTDHRVNVEDIALRRPTLDEVFLTLTGRPASEVSVPTRGRQARR